MRDETDLGRRRFLKLGAAGAAAAALLPAVLKQALAGEGAPKLNVLFVVADDMRPDLNCYGASFMKTPNIDRLAAQGILFERAYCQEALCAPSRASVLSGCRPDTTKIFDLDTPLRKAMPHVLSLPQIFHENGYRTSSLGKIYHHPEDDAANWDERFDFNPNAYMNPETAAKVAEKIKQAHLKGGNSTELRRASLGPPYECADVPDNAYADGKIADRAIEILRARGDKPFFLAVGFHRPHLPFIAPKKYFDLYDPEKLPHPEFNHWPKASPGLAAANWEELRHFEDIPQAGPLKPEQARKMVHAYAASISYTDAQLGRVLDELDKQKLREHTVVVLWGDHGWKLGDYGAWCKHTNFEYDTHAPLLLSVPGQKNAGAHSKALVEFVDIYPTLCQAAALPRPNHLEGVSLLPLVDEPNREWKTAAFSQYPRGNRMGYTLRFGPWRYTEWIVRPAQKVVARELYNHEKSAGAPANLADDPQYADLVKKLSAVLDEGRGWKAVQAALAK